MLLVIGDTVGKREGEHGIFLLVCNGLSFIGMVLGDGHKGRGVRGRGVFWENNGRLTFMTKKRKKKKKKWSRRGESFYLSVLVKIYDHSVFLLSPASHLPPRHPPSSPALFALFFSSHDLTKLLFPPEHPPDLWH